jgi:beta-glucosidase-like glycosyl hydrolase
MFSKFIAVAVTAPLAVAVVPSTVNWCGTAPQSSWDICNYALSLDTRSADIVQRLSLSDKIQALGTGTPALNSIGLPSYNWWSEATHGISHVSNSNPTPWASNTPLPITTSCSFNRTLWKSVGNQIGREARAFMNVGHADSTYWAPVINM